MLELLPVRACTESLKSTKDTIFEISVLEMNGRTPLLVGEPIVKL